jgi:hypothetical protein
MNSATNHLAALEIRLSHERARFAKDNSPIRAVWIAQIEKEIANEKKFLGIEDNLPEMSDDELLKALK